MSGRLVAVCLGPGGIPKHPVRCAEVDAEGLVGDRHRIEGHGGRQRALCLLSVEETRQLEAEGVPTLGPGGYGENLLIEGLDFFALRPGARLVLENESERVAIELFDVRSPCVTLQAIDPRFPDLMIGRSGFLAKVLVPGALIPGMNVSAQE